MGYHVDETLVGYGTSGVSVMLTVLYIISYLFLGATSCACVAGTVRIVLALRIGDRQEAKALSMSLLRIGLVLAGFVIIVVTHGRSMRVAQVLLIIMMLLGLPKDFRVLRGDASLPKPSP